MNELRPITLWQAIQRLTQQIPFTRESVEAALSVSLSLQASKRRMNDYRSQSIQLAEGVVIDDVDLRVSQTGDFPGFMVLSISGTCISQQQIKGRYPHVHLSELPHTQSPNGEWFYSTRLPWGELNFGFKQGDPHCLASLSFAPYKN